MSAFTPRVSPKCARCETIQTIPEWSENAGNETVYFWRCMTCGHEFETRDRPVDGQMSEDELAEEFLANLVVE
jgi:Zn ribbon nucleic-acid-binding protein